MCGAATSIRKVGGKLCFWRSPISLRGAVRLVEERLSFWGELPLRGAARMVEEKLSFCWGGSYLLRGRQVQLE